MVDWIEAVVGVGGIAVAYLIGVSTGRRQKSVAHKHAWGQWELHKAMKIRYSGRPHLNYETDVQERACLGCGLVERKVVSPS